MSVNGMIPDRLSSLRSFFKATQRFRGQEGAAIKGFVFVELYAIYQFTVDNLVRAAIDSINNSKTLIKDLEPSLIALYLDPEFASLKDAGQKTRWKARLKILEKAFSSDVAILSNTTPPPNDGSHYRHTHLALILMVFGIKSSPTRRKAHLYRIDEIVNHRNQIAHGLETAAQVGRRYTRQEIRARIAQMNSVCNNLVHLFENFCRSKFLGDKAEASP